jgi:4-amino-4-deoxy-L-arabinose transferase-like glycosyltransferase
VTTLLRPGPLAPSQPAVQAARGLRAWLRRHRTSIIALVVMLAVVGAATGWNLQGWPGRVDDDEGTYVAEAWAVLSPHHLSHYTYWYDHPPFGWIQIAAYIGATHGFARYASAVMAGREFMWAVALISCGLLFTLARRLGFRRGTAALATAAFGLSPLAIYYHRMVSLDNIAVMWLLATLVCAASRRRSLAAAFGTGVCLAGAVLSKETAVILLPVVVWVLWQHTEPRTRRWHLGIFAVTFTAITAVYPLFALLRGELLPGNGHVSLGWALWWQFFGRAGSGSAFSTASGTYGLVHLWLGLDPWLLLAGCALIAPGFAVRRLRPLALAMLLQVVVMLKGGYVPYFYVTAMLPFAALLLGGTADRLLDLGPASGLASGRARLARYLGRGLVAVVALAACVLVLPGWWNTLSGQSTQRGYTAEDTAVAWIEQHIPKQDVVVTDDYMWPDLELKGWNPLWLWKVTDPGVASTILKDGYKSIDYIALDTSATSAATLDSMPALKEALAHSVVVKDLGDGLTVRQVIDG